MPEIRCPLSDAAEQHPERIAILGESLQITYRRLDELTSWLANSPGMHGLTEGTRPAIVSRNRWEYVPAVLALLRLKAVAVLFSPRFPQASLVDQTTSAGCSHQLVLPGSVTHDVLPNLPQIDITFPENSPPATQQTSRSIHTGQPATIVFTSGSVAAPKAVLHTFGNHYYNALGANANIPVVPGDRWLLSLPLYHVGGLGILFRCLLGGGTIVMADPGDDLYTLILRQGITHLSLVSTQLQRLLDRLEQSGKRPKSLKAVLLGGGPISNALLARAVELQIPIYSTYGLTEMASQVATAGAPGCRQLSVLPNRQVRMSGEGEILAKGETLFAGYVEGGNLTRPLDREGWFATGDSGLFDRDQRLIITGRRDNMFFSGGENIFPEQIENALGRLAQVKESVVVPVEDSEFGHRPVAFVLLQPQANGMQPALDHAALVAHLEQLLPRFMIPVAFYPWPTDCEATGIKPQRSRFVDLARKVYHSRQ